MRPHPRPSTKQPNRPKRWFRSRAFWLWVGLGIAGSLLVMRHAYPFLAVPTHREQAEILVVEGWIYDYGFDTAAAEYASGKYTWIVTSGMTIAAGDTDSYAGRAALKLTARGVPAARILACPAPPTNWNRTSSSARAVRDQLAAQGIHYTGINVVTIGPHARQSWLAHRRIFGPAIRVGIIAVAKQGVDTDHWWASVHGTKMVIKDLAGWFKEWLFGYRH